MLTYLLERADIYIFAVEMNSMRNKLLQDQSKILKNLNGLYMKMVKERGIDLRSWLTTSVQELTGLIIRI